MHMKAAKKIRQLIASCEDPGQVQVLKDLVLSLQLGRPFELKRLYDIDIHYFDMALDLLKEWRFDHYISSRSRLIEQLFAEAMPDLLEKPKSEHPPETV